MGALIGAWIIHLSEGNYRLADELAEYKARVGPSAQVADRKALMDEIVKRWDQCRKDKEDLEAKARGTRAGGTP
jgi:hypothetical protein